MKHIVFCLLVLMSSCDGLRNEVDLARLNQEAAKIVVTCFISPQDKLLVAKIVRTRTALAEDTVTTYRNDDIKNAVVKLSEGGQSVTLRYDTKEGAYSAVAQKLPVLAGHTYLLTVQTPDGRSVMSTCTVPGPVTVSSVEFDSLAETKSGRLYHRYFVRARWLDPAQKLNFYQVTGIFGFVANRPRQPARAEYMNLDFEQRVGDLIADDDLNGNTIVSQRGYLNGSDPDTTQQTGFASQYRAANTVINLLNTDQAYYEYQAAVQQQLRVSDNPFAEPLQIPSNIQGGLGCFGAYNRSAVTVKLR